MAANAACIICSDKSKNELRQKLTKRIIIKNSLVDDDLKLLEELKFIL